MINIQNKHKIFICFIICFFFSRNLEAFLYSYETPTIKYLKPIEISELNSGIELIDCIYVINLDERPERWERMKKLLEERDLKVNRFSAINGWKIPMEAKEELFGPYPVRISSGHIGCFLSHISILKDAYERGFNSIWILEDDVEFLENVHQIPDLLKELTKLDPKWDIFYTDKDFRNKKGRYSRPSAVDPRPDQILHPLKYYLQKTPVSKDIQLVRNRYGTHSLIFSRKGMQKVLEYFLHVYLWTSIDIDIHYVPNIREYSARRDIVTNARIRGNTSHKISLNKDY